MRIDCHAHATPVQYNVRPWRGGELGLNQPKGCKLEGVEGIDRESQRDSNSKTTAAWAVINGTRSK
jgi:hypothetical protein